MIESQRQSTPNPDENKQISNARFSTSNKTKHSKNPIQYPRTKDGTSRPCPNRLTNYGRTKLRQSGLPVRRDNRPLDPQTATGLALRHKGTTLSIYFLRVRTRVARFLPMESIRGNKSSVYWRQSVSSWFRRPNSFGRTFRGIKLTRLRLVYVLVIILDQSDSFYGCFIGCKMFCRL